MIVYGVNAWRHGPEYVMVALLDSPGPEGKWVECLVSDRNAVQLADQIRLLTKTTD